MSRGEAFRALVGVKYSGETTQFPEQIVLPELIHARALEAGNATTSDQRERSVHFRYKDGSWEAGRIFRGRKLKLKGSRRKDKPGFGLSGKTNRLHDRSSYIFPPHIHVHTHPSVPEGAAKEMVGNDGIEDSVRAPLESMVSEVLAAMVLLPSFGDIARTLTMPAGSIAHLLASEWGKFLWVHRDIAATKEPPRSLLWTALGKKVYPLPKDDAIPDQKVNLNYSDPGFAEKAADVVKKCWTQSISARVDALDKAYVCYMVRDPEDATLCRVHVGETPTWRAIESC